MDGSAIGINKKFPWASGDFQIYFCILHLVSHVCSDFIMLFIVAIYKGTVTVPGTSIVHGVCVYVPCSMVPGYAQD